MVELINDRWTNHWLIKCKWWIVYYAMWLNEEVLFIDVFMITWWWTLFCENCSYLTFNFELIKDACWKIKYRQKTKEMDWKYC